MQIIEHSNKKMSVRRQCDLMDINRSWLYHKKKSNSDLDDKIAKEIGSARAMNIVMLGAASPFLNIDYNILEGAIRNLFAKKSEKIIDINLKALKAGRDFVENK